MNIRALPSTPSSWWERCTVVDSNDSLSANRAYASPSVLESVNGLWICRRQSLVSTIIDHGAYRRTEQQALERFWFGQYNNDKTIIIIIILIITTIKCIIIITILLFPLLVILVVITFFIIYIIKAMLNRFVKCALNLLFYFFLSAMGFSIIIIIIIGSSSSSSKKLTGY